VIRGGPGEFTMGEYRVVPVETAGRLSPTSGARPRRQPRWICCGLRRGHTCVPRTEPRGAVARAAPGV